jgi:general secretion pathway protein H
LRAEHNAVSPGERGFTLLELLVVLVILSLMLTLAPSLMAGGGAKLRVAARDLTFDLRQLRDNAIRDGITTSLTLDAAHHGYQLNPANRLRPLPQDADLTLTPGAPPLVGDPTPEIIFYPDGSSSGGTLTLEDRTVSYAVRVDWVGGQLQGTDVRSQKSGLQ